VPLFEGGADDGADDDGAEDDGVEVDGVFVAAPAVPRARVPRAPPASKDPAITPPRRSLREGFKTRGSFRRGHPERFGVTTTMRPVSWPLLR
jgi:hypothetical protein